MLTLLIGLALAGRPDAEDASATLDTLHRAAAEADADTYFGLFADDAVFVGTDPTERWDLPAFRAFAAPHFEDAPAWAYMPVQREVHLGPKGRTAWFYETLDHDRYGRVRGSGVLRADRGTWRVVQYVLSFPVPNDDAAAVLAITGDASPTLPPPYTAAELRAAHPVGHVTIYRYRDGAREWWQRAEVMAADDEQVSFGGVEVDAEGAPVGEEGGNEASWAQLRDHAAFPMGRTTWEAERIEVEAGTFETRRYEVAGADGSAQVFWFADDVPGPPVRMEVRGPDGAVVSSMELVARR